MKIDISSFKSFYFLGEGCWFGGKVMSYWHHFNFSMCSIQILVQNKSGSIFFSFDQLDHLILEFLWSWALVQTHLQSMNFWTYKMSCDTTSIFPSLHCGRQYVITLFKSITMWEWYSSTKYSWLFSHIQSNDEVSTKFGLEIQLLSPTI